MLEALKKLEDIAIDRELFGRDNLSKDEAATIPLSHNHLQRVKLICGFERGLHPVAAHLPRLRVFESNDHEETILSLDALSLFSSCLRGLLIKFDKSLLSKNDGLDGAGGPVAASRDVSSLDPLKRSLRALARKRSRSFGGSGVIRGAGLSSPASIMYSAKKGGNTNLSAMSGSSDVVARLQRFKYLVSVSLNGATETIVACLPSFSYLAKLRLANCDLQSHILAETLSVCENIRKLQIERCRGFDSVESLTCSKLAYLSISSCPDLRSKVIIDGANLPALEFVNISHQPKLGAITMTNLAELRWVTLQHCNASSLRIAAVPSLLDLALETVTVFDLRVEASHLIRLFLDCARTFVSEETGGQVVDVSIAIDTPELRRLSWQADDTALERAISVFSGCSKLDKLDLPSVSSEEVDLVKDELHRMCPTLRSVGCADADIDLFPTTSDLLASV
jgi:hypothetical protein